MAPKKQDPELSKTLRTIQRGMEDFESSIAELKELTARAEATNDALVQREAAHNAEMANLKRKFEDDKIATLKEFAKQAGKELISKSELDEIRSELAKIKENSAEQIEEQVAQLKQQYAETLATELKIRKFEAEKNNACLVSEVEQHKKEVINLKETLARMATELESQKKLTSEIAGISRARNAVVEVATK